MATLSSIYIGLSGLNVSQAALNVTSHNLANVETKGYVRQQVVLSDFDYIKKGESYISSMQVGLGADVATVKQVRDMFLDQAYRQETGRQAFYESQYASVQEIEGLFGELEGVPFQENLEELWISMQELSKEPDSIVARSAFIESAVSFVERADTIAKQLNKYQVNLNTQIIQQVDRINEIGEEIHKLNFKIRQYESNGLEKANDLRDQRNNLLDELSQMANITYKEHADTRVTVMLEGVPFVTDDGSVRMATAKVVETSDMLKPIWPAYGDRDVYNLNQLPQTYNNTDIGSLKGLLIARGDKQGKYTDIPKREQYESDVQYRDAVTYYNNTVNASVVMSTQAQFDQLIHGVVTMINDIFSPNKEVTLRDGTKVRILDTDNAPVGMDPDKTQGEGLFNRKSMTRYGEPEDIVIEDGEGGYITITARIYNEEDPKDIYSLFTIGEIEVNEKMLHDYNLIPLSNNDGSGAFDIETAQKLLSKWKEPFSTLSPNTLTANNFSEYYTSFIAELANRGEQFNTISKNQTSMVGSIDNQRQNVAGVSSDEELTNLIKYQHAYNASARYINVVSEMLEHIINNL